MRAATDRIGSITAALAAVILVTAVATPARANGDRPAPPPPDATTTTTTLPEETTTTTQPPVEEEATTTTTLPEEEEPVPQAPPAPTPPVTPAAVTSPTPPPAEPAPWVNLTLECPGWFVFELGNDGNAAARFVITVEIEATGRVQTAEVAVGAGQVTEHRELFALAGEEDSEATVTVYETVTGAEMVVELEDIDCVEDPEPIIIMESLSEPWCPPSGGHYGEEAEEITSTHRTDGLFGSVPVWMGVILAMLASVLLAGRRRNKVEAVTDGETNSREPA